MLSYVTASTTAETAMSPGTMPTPKAASAAPSARVPVVIAFGAVALLNLVWFSSLPGGTLMGDDLDLLLQSRTSGGYASSFWVSLTETSADKFRPVVTVVLYALTQVFDASFHSYRYVALILQILNVGLVGLLAWRLSKRSWVISVTAMVLVTVSRFNVYFVLQVFGVMEGLAVSFLLGMLLAVHRCYETGRRRPLLAASFLYLLVVFTHERFIVLGPFLLLANLLAPVTFRSWKERLAWASLPVAVASFNIVVKSIILGIDFFTGPGGQDVSLGQGQVMVHLRRAALNVIGFNTGPDYLSGRNMHALGVVGIGLGMAFAAVVAVVGVWSLARLRRRLAKGELVALRPYGLGLACLLPLLLSASITFRQEYRWLFSPYVVLILALSWALGGEAGRRHTRVLATIAVLATGLAVDGYYRRHVDNTYFFAGLRTADSIRREVIDQHRAELGTSTIFIVTNGDRVVQEWYLRDGGFFKIYGDGMADDVRFVDSVEVARATSNVRSNVLAFDFRGDRVVDVTPSLGSR